MTRLPAGTYLSRLFEAALATKVSDQKGQPFTLEEGVAKAVDALLSARAAGRRVLVVGNGGSAAIASHLHTDLSKALGIRSVVFTDAALLTAASNDNGYGRSFADGVRLWTEPGDLLVAVSSSGRSENILRAVEEAGLKGARTITFSGFREDTPLRAAGELNFWVPSDAYGYVEVSHQALAHLITDRTAIALGLDGKGFP